jgi:hypothetical protein
MKNGEISDGLVKLHGESLIEHLSDLNELKLLLIVMLASVTSVIQYDNWTSASPLASSF